MFGFTIIRTSKYEDLLTKLAHAGLSNSALHEQNFRLTIKNKAQDLEIRQLKESVARLIKALSKSYRKTLRKHG